MKEVLEYFSGANWEYLKGTQLVQTQHQMLTLTVNVLLTHIWPQHQDRFHS